jgi:hypothetical protein
VPLRSPGLAIGSVGPSESLAAVSVSGSNPVSIKDGYRTAARGTRMRAWAPPRSHPPRPRPGVQPDVHKVRDLRPDSVTLAVEQRVGIGPRSVRRIRNLLATPIRTACRPRKLDVGVFHRTSRGSSVCTCSNQLTVRRRGMCEAPKGPKQSRETTRSQRSLAVLGGLAITTKTLRLNEKRYQTVFL